MRWPMGPTKRDRFSLDVPTTVRPELVAESIGTVEPTGSVESAGSAEPVGGSFENKTDDNPV